VIPLLPKDAPIFAPDLPGYGGSAPISSNDKLSAGNAILDALKEQLKAYPDPIPIVLIGHDRGARVAHRLTVSGYKGMNILGSCFIDIVPTSTQWQQFASPVRAAKAITGYFHFALLANVDLAVSMITAYGSGKWVSDMTKRWTGSNATGIKSLQADDAMAVYCGYFENEDIIRATCEDYKHGATTDLEAQEHDQKEGKKIGKPLLLLYGADFIGKRYEFPEVWRDWVEDGVQITDHGLGNGIGHFGAEEAPEECARVVNEWVKGLNGGAKL
jgi:pimeloyl-ACP methyl ester carboxylesterase